MAVPILSRTRVCIKNLPPTTEEQELKDFLSKTAKTTLEITDCKVLRNAKGKSRKVAFVGFRREEQAQHVVDNFHKTYLRMSRLSVEPATAKKENETTNEKDNDNNEKNEKNKHKNNSAKKDGDKDSKEANSKMSKKKEELLKLMNAGSSKTKFWANDDGDGDYAVAPVVEPEEEKEQETLQSSDDDDDDDSDESSSESSSDDDDDDDDEEQEPTKQQQQQKKKPISDMDFLRSKQKDVQDLAEEVVEEDTKPDKEEGSDSSSSDDSDSDSGSSDDDEPDKVNDKKDKPTTETMQVERDAQNDDNNANDMMEEDDDDDEEETQQGPNSQTRLFVRNLPFDASEEELEAYFGTIGPVIECHIPIDDQKRSKGFAFIAYASKEDALAARTQLDKLDFQGRLLHILPSRAPPVIVGAGAGMDTRNLTWKQRQELARKEAETKGGANGSSAKGWSASFVRGDAVVDNLADRLGLRKGDLLGVKDKLSSGDAAVRLALGETQIIEENREYFRTHGVDMDALVSANANDKTIKRSKTGILVKNLPYDTREEELTKLFHVGEAPLQILLPPSRTIALVEYGHSNDAKRAFKKLAYRRFKHVPIYLEWAPLVAKTTTKTDNKAKTAVQQSGSKENVATQNSDAVAEQQTKKQESSSSLTADLQDAEMTVDEGTGSATIYVKNLNFQTTESTLQEVFEKALGGGVRAVRIPKKASVIQTEDEEAKLLSMGYGFVELAPPELAKKAISKLQGKLVDGHEWALSISSSKQNNNNQKQKKQSESSSTRNHTKLMVRNVAFQATRQELLKLFGSFGSLRKVRLPKKFDGTHRGFAFVEYLTAKEAQTAMTSLSGTHLYGRHLVLEWASEDDNDLGKLRDKAKRDAGGVTAQPPQNKKIKFT